MAEVLAYQTGRPLRRIPDDVMRKTAQQMISDQQSAPEHFAALRRLLDHDEPDHTS